MTNDWCSRYSALAAASKYQSDRHLLAALLDESQPSLIDMLVLDLVDDRPVILARHHSSLLPSDHHRYIVADSACSAV